MTEKVGAGATELGAGLREWGAAAEVGRGGGGNGRGAHYSEIPAASAGMTEEGARV